MINLPPASRNSDFITSYIAEERAPRRRQIDIVYGLVKMYPGKTAAELSACSGVLDHVQTQRRLSDLQSERIDLIETGACRKCAVKGSLMVTWHPKVRKMRQRSLI